MLGECLHKTQGTSTRAIVQAARPGSPDQRADERLQITINIVLFQQDPILDHQQPQSINNSRFIMHRKIDQAAAKHLKSRVPHPLPLSPSPQPYIAAAIPPQGTAVRLISSCKPQIAHQTQSQLLQMHSQTRIKTSSFLQVSRNLRLIISSFSCYICQYIPVHKTCSLRRNADSMGIYSLTVSSDIAADAFPIPSPHSPKSPNRDTFSPSPFSYKPSSPIIPSSSPLHLTSKPNDDLFYPTSLPRFPSLTHPLGSFLGHGEVREFTPAELGPD